MAIYSELFTVGEWNSCIGGFMKTRLLPFLALPFLFLSCSTQKSTSINSDTVSSVNTGVATTSECAVFENYDHVVTRIDFKTEQDRLDLVRTFEPIGGTKEQGYLLFDVSKENFERLRLTGLSRGWKVSIDEKMTAKQNDAHAISHQSIKRYPCYRTVKETYRDMKEMAEKYPNLVSLVSIGPTWLKTQHRGGHDMYVLKLTNKSKRGTKPKAVFTSAIHGREYATAEFNTRLAEHLLANYGKDPDITWILDSQEVHLILQTNPDGREKAEQGWMWRKNVNNTRRCYRTSKEGVDLNRNFEFLWGVAAADRNPCSEQYMGPHASSEPEVQNLQRYLRSVFNDNRGPKETDAAPLNAAGIYIDIHSYSELVMWPWGYTKRQAPNAEQLRALGTKLASFNNYKPIPLTGLYENSGSTIDFAYGDLGVASFAYELGKRFFESCREFNKKILPDNINSFMYALKVARAPYRMSGAPDIIEVRTTKTNQNNIQLSAQIKPNKHTRHTRAVEAEYFIDTPPWENGKAHRLDIQQSGQSGNITADITSSLRNLERGQHTIYVRAKNSKGHYGPVSAVFINTNK